MNYVDLNRTFVRVNASDPLSFEGLAELARRYQAVTWPEVLAQPRVVVLAEAGSGKTEEFRQRARLLTDAGDDAFFAALEQVAELGLTATLGGARAAAFAAWRQSSRPGWLFLDSVDEAKLQRHSLERAFVAVAEALGDAAARSFVLVSCRGTDWDSERDLVAFQDHLPPPPLPTATDPLDADALLVSVLDSETRADTPAAETPPIAVFSLNNLSLDQQRAFLIDRKVEDLDAFVEQVQLRGLEPLAERPGDLAMLVAAWSAAGFAPLREMLEAHVTQRLRERDDRADADELTDAEARHDAERLAAAMTLGKVLTLKSPNDEDPAEDALDPADVLPDRRHSQRAALLRRGIFTPSTYGRVRFHHRSALEYLTAAWFARLLEAGKLGEADILKVFRRTACGVTTVPPSLRPAAAWLAPKCPGLLQVLLREEPLTLIAHGDPSGLPLSVRADLLRQFAEKHAKGEVAHEFVDQHALWMFADPALGDAVRDAWTRNIHDDLRFELLRLIDLGKITSCADLVRAEALNPSASSHNRIVAARALRATADAAGLAALAAEMLATPKGYGPRLAPQLTLALFPAVLSVAEVLTLIEQTPPPRPYQVEGFGYVLADLYAACLTAADRAAFLESLAALCRQAPLVEHETLSKRHSYLARRIGDVARRAVLQSGQDGVGAGVIRVLQVAESTDLEAYGGETPSLRTLVHQRPALNRALFWADVQASFAADPDERANPQIWRLRLGQWRTLWTLDCGELAWLETESRERADDAERRIALSAIHQLLVGTPNAAEALDALAQRIADDAVLAADLAVYRKPLKTTPMQRKWAARDRQRARKEAVRKAQNSEGWRKLRREVSADTTLLTDNARLREWPGPNQLFWLTVWLRDYAKLEMSKAPTEWRRLAGAFGEDVAQAYATGMKLMWRLTDPERPEVNPEGGTITKHSVLLAIGGLNLEAGDPKWLSKLNPTDAARVIDHLCLDQQTLPEWLNDLVRAWPAETTGRVLTEIEREWALPEDVYTPFLTRAESGLPLVGVLRTGLLALIDRPPTRLGHVVAARRILRRAALTPEERPFYATLIAARLAKRRKADDWPWRVAYLAILFELDVALATAVLRDVLDREPIKLHKARALQAIGDLFGMRGGAVAGLEQADIATLEALLRLTYEVVLVGEDLRRSGHYTPSDRDEAESGRNRVLTALIAKGGPPAHAALMGLIRDKLIGDRIHRFQQIAWEVGEKETDAWQWRPRDVVEFETHALSPLNTGDDLLRLTIGAIDDISFYFQNGDFSSRELLETAQGEFAVQNWLADQLRLRTKGLAMVTREKQILHDNRPDIALTSTAASVEVALELKHGEMHWPLPALRSALRDQLAEDYLRIPTRRHGLFVITNHRATRFWRDPVTKVAMTFDEVIDILREDAAAIQANSAQWVKVEVRGIDATKPVPVRKAQRKAKADKGMAAASAGAARPTGQRPAKT